MSYGRANLRAIEGPRLTQRSWVEMSMREPNYFDNYWISVRGLVAGNPKSRGLATRLDRESEPVIDGPSAVRKLFDALGGDRWKNPRSVSRENWVWRDGPPRHNTLLGEVALERSIVLQGGSDQWTCQMPTASGLHGEHVNKRRSIDLVRRSIEGVYTFVELKTTSDQPLYAAFEILGYGLAYLHARRAGLRGLGRYNVMEAQRIDLVVLAPEAWYANEAPRGDDAPLTRHLNAGLESVRSWQEGFPAMRFRFETFGSQDTKSAAIEICGKRW